jgi:hypothetical protein
MNKKSVLYGLLVCLVIIFLGVPLQSSDVCNAPPPKGPPPDKVERSCLAQKYLEIGLSTFPSQIVCF